MKHKNCMKCGKALTTLETQQSGIGPECVKSVRQKILIRITQDPKTLGLLEGEAERILNELDYDIVMLVEQGNYSSSCRIRELHWMDDTPPFFHKMEWEGVYHDGTCISDAPKLAIANLLDRLGYQRTKNNRMFIIEEIWASHTKEMIHLDKTEGCGIVDDLPCIVHLDNVGDDEDFAQWFENEEQGYLDCRYGGYGNIYHYHSKSEYPELNYATLHLFSEGFPEPIVKLLDEDMQLLYDFEQKYREEYSYIDDYRNLWYFMGNCENDNLYSVGNKTVPNAYRIMERWVSENLENYIQRFIPPNKDEHGFGRIVITAKNREQLMEDLRKEIVKVTKTNGEWEFNGYSAQAFHKMYEMMNEFWMGRFWDDRYSSVTRVNSKELDSFIESYLEKLNEKGESLPAIETWH